MFLFCFGITVILTTYTRSALLRRRFISWHWHGRARQSLVLAREYVRMRDLLEMAELESDSFEPEFELLEM